MQSIALPKKIEFQKTDDINHELVIIEPCYPGYGITLGNSLRRVLLSSLPGAAVVGVKIKGADHEFMTLPHIKEDILEIVLNLKQIRLKVREEGIIRLELDVHGEKTVTAGHIKANSSVEIINSDLEIAHITDMAGNISMEIFVSQGRGYETIESRESGKNELGYIEMDSIYSPVMSVGIKVENVRVGKITNWDKLVLDVVTDGTISPQEAFEQTVQILIDQFNALVDLEKSNQTENIPEVGEESPSVVDDAEDVRSEAAEGSDEVDAKKRRGRPKKS